MIGARQRPNATCHAVAAVDVEEHVLRTFDPDLTDDEPSLAGARLPRDLAEVVSGNVVAQSVELATLADARRDAGPDAAEEERIELRVEASDGAEIGQHPHELRSPALQDPFDEAKARDGEVRSLHRLRATRHASHFEGERQGFPGRALSVRGAGAAPRMSGHSLRTAMRSELALSCATSMRVAEGSASERTIASGRTVVTLTLCSDRFCAGEGEHQERGPGRGLRHRFSVGTGTRSSASATGSGCRGGA